MSNRTVEDETLITAGLLPGEMIVTDGQSLLIDGSSIQIKNNSGGAGPAPSDGGNGTNQPEDQPDSSSGGRRGARQQRTTP